MIQDTDPLHQPESRERVGADAGRYPFQWMADTGHELGREQHEIGFACEIRQRLVYGTIAVPILEWALILHRLSPVSRSRHGRCRLPIEVPDWLSLVRCADAISIGTAIFNSRSAVTKQESQSARERDSYWLVEPLPAAREKLVENGTIDTEHRRNRAHR